MKNVIMVRNHFAWVPRKESLEPEQQQARASFQSASYGVSYLYAADLRSWYCENMRMFFEYIDVERKGDD
jgi:hypothetical protein